RCLHRVPTFELRRSPLPAQTRALSCHRGDVELGRIGSARAHQLSVSRARWDNLPMDAAPRLVLASTSRYRRELLQRLRLPFIVIAPDVDETPPRGEAPAALAQRLALAKATAVAAREPQAIVIGSDQVAELDGAALGK